MSPEAVIFVTYIEGWPVSPAAVSAVLACEDEVSFIISWEADIAYEAVVA